jgi:hypothetical protein
VYLFSFLSFCSNSKSSFVRLIKKISISKYLGKNKCLPGAFKIKDKIARLICKCLLSCENISHIILPFFHDYYFFLMIKTCRGIITAPSHAKLKVQYPPPPHGITAHAWGDPYAHTCTSLCSPNGQPTIQAKYTYSTLLPAFLFGCVVYASATLVTDFTCSL